RISKDKFVLPVNSRDMGDPVYLTVARNLKISYELKSRPLLEQVECLVYAGVLPVYTMLSGHCDTPTSGYNSCLGSGSSLPTRGDALIWTASTGSPGTV